MACCTSCEDRLEKYVAMNNNHSYDLELGFLDNLNLGNFFNVQSTMDITADVLGSHTVTQLGLLSIAEKAGQETLLTNEDGTVNQQNMAIALNVVGNFMEAQNNAFVSNYGIGMKKASANLAGNLIIKNDFMGLGTLAEKYGMSIGGFNDMNFMTDDGLFGTDIFGEGALQDFAPMTETLNQPSGSRSLSAAF